MAIWHIQSENSWSKFRKRGNHWDFGKSDVFLTIRYHASSSSIKCNVCHRVGERRHTPEVCSDRKKQTNHYPKKPATQKEPTNYSYQPQSQSTDRKKFQKSCYDIRVAKTTICNELHQTHLCRSQLLEHRPYCRYKEPLRYNASKSCQLIVRRVNDRAYYRDA